VQAWVSGPLTSFLYQIGIREKEYSSNEPSGEECSGEECSLECRPGFLGSSPASCSTGRPGLGSCWSPGPPCALPVTQTCHTPPHPPQAPTPFLTPKAAHTAGLCNSGTWVAAAMASRHKRCTLGPLGPLGRERELRPHLGMKERIPCCFTPRSCFSIWLLASSMYCTSRERRMLLFFFFFFFFQVQHCGVGVKEASHAQHLRWAEV